MTGGRAGLVARIHNTPTMLVLAVTGGGVASIGDLLSVAGASRTILEVVVPYAEAALPDLLGGSAPDQAVSELTAVEMAAACHRRGRQLHPDVSEPVIGVAATAALVSDRAKRGEHRAHVAVHGDAGPSGAWELTLHKGARDRLAEDRIVSDLILFGIAQASGLQDSPLPALTEHDRLVVADIGVAIRRSVGAP